MTGMVERVARALFLRDVEEDVCDGTWEENAALHDRILADARAAIDAMRDPTPAMIDAVDMPVYSLVEEPELAFERAWGAMIDAALTDAGRTAIAQGAPQP